MEIARDEYWPIAAGAQELVVARRMRGAEWLYQDAQPSAEGRGLHVMQEGKAGGAAVEEETVCPVVGFFVDFTGCEDLLEQFETAAGKAGLSPADSALDLIYLFCNGMLGMKKQQ